MKMETERKFLVNADKWLTTEEKGQSEYYRQGYLLKDPQKTIRVRITDTKAFITIKGKGNGISRPEFEYEIPQLEAKELLDNFCSGEIVKTRHTLNYQEKIWEVDLFYGDNEGLILAEIELNNENEPFEIPEWISKEVTGDIRFYNSSLNTNPYKNWKDNPI